MTFGEAAAFYDCATPSAKRRITAAGKEARAHWASQLLWTGKGFRSPNRAELVAADNAAAMVQVIVEMHRRYSVQPDW